MVNPGAFRGLRKDFLMGEKATYNRAVAGGYRKDAVADIQHRFFKRFPVDLPLEEEPSAEFLASVNDADADAEPMEPNEDDLTPEQYATEMTKVKERQKRIIVLKGQIKRRLEYQYMRDNSEVKQASSSSGALDEYRLLLGQLTETSSKAPRLRTPANLWRKSCSRAIEDEVTRRAKKDNIDRKKLAPVREKVARELFDKLSQAEKDDWANQTKEEHKAAIEKWKQERTAPPSTCSADRQGCIQNLTSFVQPILDGICAVTGWKVTLIAGGPEPAHGGRLNVISVHSGVTWGDIKMNFGRAEQERYQKHIVPIFSAFLQKCYTIDECCECALLEGEGLEGLETMEPGDFNVDSLPTHLDSNDALCSVQPPITFPDREHADSSREFGSNEPGRRTLSLASRAHTPTPSSISLPHSPSASETMAVENPFAWLDNEQPDSLSGEGLMPGMPIVAPVGVTMQELAVQDEDKGLTSVGNVNSAMRQGKHKRRLDDAVSVDDEVNDPSKRTSKRRRVSAQHPKASTAVNQPELPRRLRSGAGRSKKQITPSGPPPSAAPPWFLSCQQMFSLEGLGNEWDKLVLTWANFEKQNQYKEAGRPTTFGRPIIVNQWIVRGRGLERSKTW